MAKQTRHLQAQRTSTARLTAPSSPLANLSPFTRDLLCLVALYLVTLILFRAIIFDNAGFQAGGDTAAALSFAQAGSLIHQQEKGDVLWMPYFFSGMPTFGNVAYIPRNVNYLQTYLVQVLDLLYLHGKWTWYCVYFLMGGCFMFALMRVLKFSRPAALLAALTFMLSPFAVGLPGEGHGSKLMTLSYLPLVFLLTHLVFERRTLLSLGLLSMAIGTQLLANHMQIVYYSFLILGGYLLYHIIRDIRNDTLLVAKKTALFAGAVVLGLCIASYIYLSVYEYAQYSMRGGGTTGSTGGLAFDYATNWSWSPWELITLIVPAFYGLKVETYWGHIEPWNNSAVYVGLVPLFLALLAVIYRRKGLTLFFAIATGVVILLSFGRNFPVVYELLFRVLPFFNKFRAPLMILHLLPFLVGVLAATGYGVLVEMRERPKESRTDPLRRLLWYGAGILAAAGLLVLMMKTPLRDMLSGGSLLRPGEEAQLRQQYGTRAGQAVAYVTQARFDILWNDLVKSFLLAACVLAAAAAYLSRKIQIGAFSTALILLLVIDLFIIDQKYITPQPANGNEETFQPDATVQFLKQQPGLFRIFPVGQDSRGQQLFQDNSYAYHGLQSIGGYSPAKLRIYQTLLDSCLYHGPDPAFPLNMNVVNMLNVRYIIAPGRLPEDRFELAFSDAATRLMTYRNPGALPRAFFVERAIVAQDDHTVFSVMNAPDFNAGTTAVVQQAPPLAVGRTDSSSAVITDYKARRITLQAFTAQPALLVLSEVYYPAGWKAFIDGTETAILRTDYVLRSVAVPAGTHEIVFAFDPPLYTAGWVISNTAWGICLLLVLIGLWRTPWVRQRIRRNAPTEAPAA